MSNDQVINKLDNAQEQVKSTLGTLRQILIRASEIKRLENELASKGVAKEDIEKLTSIHSGLLVDIDAHIDSISRLIEDYQSIVRETI
jgi:DUF438 domain-containing protein